MTKVDNGWPLMVVNLPKETALWKEPVLRLPSPNQQETAILDKIVKRRSDASREKGTFVDLYI